MGTPAAHGMRGASRDHVRRQDQHHSRGFHNDPLSGSAVAAPGVQGHCRLSRVGDSVNGLLDVHAAACGLIQDPALRHPVAQGGACGRGSHLGQRCVIGAGLRVLFGAPAFAGAVAPFPRGAEGGHADRRRRRFRGRASRGGLRYCLQVGVRARVPLWGVSVAVSESQCPDDLVCRVQRRTSGACFAWGRRFRHCCVAVPKSRGWGADVRWLVRGTVTQALHGHLTKHTESPMEAAAHLQLEAVRRAAAQMVHRKHLLLTHAEQLTDPTAREHMQRLIHYHAVHDPDVH